MTSVFAGFVIFAFMGYLAHETGQTIDQVVQAGFINFNKFVIILLCSLLQIPWRKKYGEKQIFEKFKDLLISYWSHF